MDNVARVRRASVRVAKVQRRLWLLQALLWPVVTIGLAVTAITVGHWAWRRYSSTTSGANDVVLASTNGSGPRKPAEERLNSAPGGNLSG